MHCSALPPTQTAAPLPKKWSSSTSPHWAPVPTLTLAQALVTSVPVPPLGLALAKGAPAALARSRAPQLATSAVSSAREARLAVRPICWEAAAAFPFTLAGERGSSTAPTTLAAAPAAVGRPAPLCAGIAKQGNEQLPRGLHASVSSTAGECPLLSRIGAAIAAATS